MILRNFNRYCEYKQFSILKPQQIAVIAVIRKSETLR